MIVNIQVLRGIAVILVVLNHAAQQSSHVGEGTVSFVLGACGVDIFFVISGFIMCTITEQNTGSLNFIARRFIRVAPPYILITCFMALIILIAPSLFHSSAFDPFHFIASLLFIAYPHPELGDAVPLYLPGWTLNYEFAFYIVFSIFLTVPMQGRILATSFVLILLVLTGLALHAETKPVPAFYTNSILIEFIYGMITYAIYTRGPRWPSPVAIATLCAAPIILLLLQHDFPTARGLAHRFLTWGIPAWMTVCGALMLERNGSYLKWRWPLFIGDASYAIYLTHLFTIGIVAVLWHRIYPHLHLSDLLLMTTCLLCSIGVGSVFFLYVERPLIRRLRKRLVV